MRTLVKAQCGVPASNRFFFDDIFGREFYRNNELVKTTPAVNVKEDDKQFSLEVAAPGLQKEDFKVELNDGILSISSEKKTETTEGNEQTKYSRREFSYQSFKRNFALDQETVDAENVTAKYENGVLYVAIPKKVKVEEEKRARTISIS